MENTFSTHFLVIPLYHDGPNGLNMVDLPVFISLDYTKSKAPRKWHIFAGDQVKNLTDE